ncbi:MAG: NADP-dependent oxidoreductase [Bryobacterales bacterium]|nr:NADP-dependent oxidoreductase [Bryobacterales bacterium]MBV9399181.1 NADP-dependent oxidoreductase [Bryobacterales bacterium]
MTRASAFLERNVLVRLVGYHNGAKEAGAEFVEKWSLAATDRPPRGLLYRDLARQVPEWGARIAREIQEPIPFEFLDYAVLLADADVPEVEDPPADSYQRVTATYEVPFRLFAEADVEPEVILYNLFEVIGPPQMVQGFMMGWAPRGDFMSRQDGFFSAALHRLRSGSLPATVFNRAEWRSVAAYEKAMDPFDRAFPQNSRVTLPAGSRVTSRLGLFRVEARIVPPKPQRKQMTAVVMRQFGGPDVLHVESVPRPVAGPGQLLVRVRAVAVNPLDAKMRAGAVRELYPAWFPDVLGYDIAGTVEDVGEGVPRSRIGEEVFGASPPWARSGYAEYAVVEAAAFYKKPAALNFAAASTVCSALATADNALFALAALSRGQTALIHGASGAVGGFAVQLAQRAGARVIATASGRNVPRVLDLGADVVVDYKKDRFEDHAREVDVVLDTIGGDTRVRSFAVLRRGGVLVTLVPPPPDQEFAAKHGIRALWVCPAPRRRTEEHA